MNTQKSIRIPFSAFVILFLAAGLFTGCEKEAFTPQGESTDTPFVLPEADLQQHDPGTAELTNDAFEVQLIWADCAIEGRSYEVITDRSEDYAYRWTVNGQKAGHEATSPDCLCEGTATVYVTRLKDGHTQSRQQHLLPCGGLIE